MELLKLTEPMMKGPAVRRLQELGDLLGVDGGPKVLSRPGEYEIGHTG